MKCTCGSQDLHEHRPHTKDCGVYQNTSIGCMIAQRLTSALCGKGIPYAEIAEIVYSECLSIAKESQSGDWLEMPDGTTYYRR